MNKEEVEKTKNQVILEKGKDMSLPKFIEWLNDNFQKSSGKKFTAQDAYAYIKRGNLPYHFGIWKLEDKNYPEIGVRVIRPIDLKKD